MKRVVVLACALLIGLVGAAPADAAARPKWVKPGAPTGVSVVAGKSVGKAVLTWSSPSDAGSRRVYGYSIVRESGGARAVSWQRAHRDPQQVYSRTFGKLPPGVATTLTVKAWSLAGGSPAATVTYTPPASPPPTTPIVTVYAVNADGDLISVPASGGVPVPVVSGVDVSRLTAAGPEAVFYADDTAHTVERIAVGSPTPTTVATGLTGPADIAADLTGNVYIADGSTVTKVTPAAVTSTVFTAPGALEDVAGATNGALAVSYDVDGSRGFATVSPSGVVTPRPVGCEQVSSCFPELLAADDGTFFTRGGGGGSGFFGWERFSADATEPVEATTAIAYNAATVRGNVFYLLETEGFCAGVSEQTGSCTPDRSVSRIQTFRTDGAPAATVPVSGLRIPFDGAAVAVGAAGEVYLASTDGLFSVPAGGGAATVLAAGSYTQVAVVG